MNLKARVDKTKQFVKEHQTTVACAVTAAITWKLTKNATLNSVLNETTDLAYKWGNETGILEFQNAIMFDFINNKGYADELREFIASLKE